MMSSEESMDASPSPKCVLCEKPLAAAQQARTNCGHEFHKMCIENYGKTHSTCPTCKSIGFEKVPPVTRGQQGRMQTPPVGQTASEASGITMQNVSKIVEQHVKNMSNSLLTQLSEKMAQLIETNIGARFPQVSEQNVPEEQVQEFQSLRPHSAVGSDLGQRPDKVGHIINGWKLRFNGHDGLSVDNFIYRVEALTHQTLEGNFSVLCSNASILFDGKAREFYWRYHKSSRSLGWISLCEALRKQFRDTRTDVDF